MIRDNDPASTKLIASGDSFAWKCRGECLVAEGGIEFMQSAGSGLCKAGIRHSGMLLRGYGRLSRTIC